MNPGLDPLADRVASWAAQIGGEESAASGELALQGWALREALRRRGASGDYLVETVEQKLGPIPAKLIPGQIERATHAWNRLLEDLDSTDENFEHVRQQARDVFFMVLEALMLAEDSGDEAAETAAAGLFNAVVIDLYAFESMADVAAELRRWGRSETQLSDLLCDGVAGLFGGEVRVRPRVEIEEEVEAFIPISQIVHEKGAAKGASSGKSLTPAALEKKLAKFPWWYVKWAAQRLTLAVMAKSGDLMINIWSGEDPSRLALSKEMDGWQVRLGADKEAVVATVSDGTAAMKLPKRIESFLLQIKSPAGEEWVELFARSAERI